MTRQHRRRENFLKRRSEFPPAKEYAEGDDKNGRAQAEGDLLDKKVASAEQMTGEEIDNNMSLDLAPQLARGLVENSSATYLKEIRMNPTLTTREAEMFSQKIQ